MNKTEQEVWATVRAMNRCWTCGNLVELEKLPDYFHDRMVALTPVDRYRLEGREACIAGWSNFARHATIHTWEEKEVLVQVFDEAAVVTYYYELAGEADGTTLFLTGRDMLTLIREHGRWLVAADQFSPFPQQYQGATQ